MPQLPGLCIEGFLICQRGSKLAPPTLLAVTVPWVTSGPTWTHCCGGAIAGRRPCCGRMLHFLPASRAPGHPGIPLLHGVKGGSRCSRIDHLLTSSCPRHDVLYCCAQPSRAKSEKSCDYCSRWRGQSFLYWQFSLSPLSSVGG